MNFKKVTALLIAALLIITFNVPAYSKTSSTVLYDNEIGRGVTYTQKLVKDGSKKQLLNIVTCDLKDQGAGIVFSKAKDIEKKEEVLSKQVSREIFKGNNVVAGINADMFDMGTGFSSGPQIKDGAILTAHNAKSEENIYPVFGIDNDKKAFISYIHLDARLTIDATTGSAIEITTPSAVNSGDFISIDNVNRENYTNKLIINTYQLNENNRIDFSQYASNGALTVVKGISGPIKLGEEYEGIVESVGFGQKSIDIPKDKIVLCSNGTKAQWIKNHLKAGNKIRIRVSYDKDNIYDAVGAYTYFLRNGKVLTNNEMIKAGAKPALVTARKSRTALGITRDNRVIAISVDGGTPSKGISDGITLLEMANLLKSMGAVDGVGFDGGGSTQMNVRLYGESNVSIVNKPSDGRERALTNGVMFVSSNERTNEAGTISIPQDITIFKNMPYKFLIKGMDTNFNSLNLSNASLNWSCDSSIGKIDSNGVLSAGNSQGQGKVRVSIGGVSTSANVKVVDRINTLNLNVKSIVPLQPLGSKQFNIEAKDSSGKTVIINNTAAKWSVTGNLGKINASGLLTVTAGSGNGQVTAQVGDKKVSVKVAIMQDAETIDDFEHNDITRYVVSGTIGGIGTISKDFSKSGLYSYKISYDYDNGWDRKSNGTIVLTPTCSDKGGNDLTGYYTSGLKPKRLGLWVYGDGHAPMLEASITDGDANRKNLVLVNKINWTGWKFIECDIPSDYVYPIMLNSIFFSESNTALHYKGDIYIDDVKFIYSDGEDNKAPDFSNFSPQGIVYSNNINIGVTIKDKSGIEKRSIWAKLDGKSVQTEFDEDTGRLNYEGKNLKSGSHTFEVQAMDCVGNVSNPKFLGKFNISNEKDYIPPVISGLLPGNKSVIKTTIPRITASIRDLQSGINVSDISILLDGVKLKADYDETTGLASTLPNAPIAGGVHKISVSASDRSGNIRKLQTISFTVNPIKQPSDPNNFSVSVISDSHAAEFANEIFDKVEKDNSELVIQNGDLIDSDTPAQWAIGLKQISVFKNKQIVMSPGNHEASAGNDNDFIKNFGMPTYSFEYGNSLFISLNSSVGQSLSLNDPTQFSYLSRVLGNNKKQNVFIYTHVPTRDNAGINHSMIQDDVKKLEKLLSDYKKANPDKNINVVFGHLHAFQSWTVGGVTYTIDGNECLKKYVDPQNGGFMGYTRFLIENNKVSHKFVPVAQNIAVVDNAIANGEMKVIKGTIKKLNLWGDFKMYNADYTAPLNNISGTDVKWESDNPDIVSVNDGGTITVNAVGSAVIKAEVLDNVYSFKVISEEQNDNYLAGFKVTPASKSISPGKTVRIDGMGYNLYGEGFKIDPGQIKWVTSQGTVNDGLFTLSFGAADGAIVEINAVYKQYVSKISLTVSNKSLAKYVIVTASGLNVRDISSISGNIIGKLNLGDRVEVLGEENGWIKINLNGKMGYISKTYVKSE